jgi:hypothetical protein
MSTETEQGSGEAGKSSPRPHLHIFVNRRKFDEQDGVTPVMTGRQIAALVEVPPELAVVRRGDTGDSPQIGLDDHLEIREGEHFLVTRSTVEGGDR